MMFVALLCASMLMPGEPCTRAPVTHDPFPDRMSAFVWRNWFCVSKERLSEVVGTSPERMEALARQMGLPPQPAVNPHWRRKGYITIVRRNWHLLPYDQLVRVIDMSPEEFRFRLKEDDFLFTKLGKVKPLCEPLKWRDGQLESGRAVRERIARILREEGACDFSEEERFSFIAPLARADGRARTARKEKSPFDFRLIFSYFAEFADPLADPDVASFPEGLLEKLADQGVNAVWLHTVLATLARDPLYPEFGEGSEKRLANLRTLVARAEKYGIKVYLYMNEPRSRSAAFFEKGNRAEMRGGLHRDRYAMCTSSPETRRWVHDALKQVFSSVKGLGGIFTITMSENLTNCASGMKKERCARCRGRKTSEIIAEINNTMIEGMLAGDPDAEALVWDWAWPAEETADVISRLPKKNCRVMAVSENGVVFTRGGVESVEDDYSMSVIGPGAMARATWDAAGKRGIGSVAKVQANCTWELSPFPYLPVMDLVAEHAHAVAKEGVTGVMLSWSLGCFPSPNLCVYRDYRASDTSPGEVLDRIAVSLYGEKAPRARAAWKAFSDGFREYPFHVMTAYFGPQHMGPANPLYEKPTGYPATMVGFPYDAFSGDTPERWRSVFPEDVWIGQMQKVADGFAEGCRLMEGVETRKEVALFRAEQMHFASCADQARFYRARKRGDRAAMDAAVRRELARAKDYLPLMRGDSRIGYECSNHYFAIPQDIREKIVSCRMLLERPAPKTEVLLFCDTEDFTNERSSDAVRDIARLFTEEGVRGHFATVGLMAKRWVDSGRDDVIEALRPHVIGCHTLSHSIPPDIIEKADVENARTALSLTLADEARAFGMIEVATGRKPVFGVPPGVSKTCEAMYAYHLLGAPFYCDTVVDDGRGGDLWYANVRQRPYFGKFSVEDLLPAPGRDPDFGKILDILAEHPRVCLYQHPNQAVWSRFWDSLNYRWGRFSEWGRWKLPPARTKEDTELYYARQRELIRRIKADGRFRFTDLEETLARTAPRVLITRDDIPMIRRDLAASFGCIRAPSWCVADIFQAAVVLLNGGTSHLPGTVRGFAVPPVGVSAPVTVRAEDLRAAAAKIDLSDFIPSSVTVGDKVIGPADFLFAALEVIETRAGEVVVRPRDQLGDMSAFPPLRKFKPVDPGFRKTFKDRWVSDRLKLQFWTIRYE